jgi:formate dehydrogenase iron-sulfur subunit
MKRVRVYVPRETAAISAGADAVAVEIARLGKASFQAGGPAVEIVRNGSRGAAWLEPLVEVVVNQTRVAYGNVAPADVTSLFTAGFLEGGEHPRRLGDPETLPWFARQTRHTFRRTGIIDPVSIDEYRAHGGFTALERALAGTADEVLDAVKASGLRGRGGAAFPAGIKWETVKRANAPRKYIACNADEGDSGTFADRLLMEGDPFTLIEGMTLAAYAVGASHGYIYLRSEYPLAESILSRALDVAQRTGWLGDNIQNSRFSFDIELHIGAGSYVCGEETAMLESLEGKRGIVRSKPPLPAIEGLFGAPTLVNNVITLASVPAIVADGAASYTDLGSGKSRGTLTVQLAGNVRRGGLVEVPFGIPLETIVADWGGGTLSGRPIKAVQVGGPLGAHIPADQLDLPLDYEAFMAAGAMLGHGGVVVYDDTTNMADLARFAFEFCAIESCGKCTPCRIGSTRGAELIERLREGGDREADYDLLVELCDTMEQASLCAMGGMTPYPVVSILKHFADDFAPQGVTP